MYMLMDYDMDGISIKEIDDLHPGHISQLQYISFIWNLVYMICLTNYLTQ